MAAQGAKPTTTDAGMLTVREVAAYLGVQPATVRRWLSRGVLPGVNLSSELHGNPRAGAGWRIPRGVLAQVAADAYANADGI